MSALPRRDTNEEMVRAATADLRTPDIESRDLVALVGPPNSGKTSVFNKMTGLRHKVANYPGVTVEQQMGYCRTGDRATIGVLDLPGIHGFAGRSADQRITRDALQGRLPSLPAPRAILLTADATRLETHLVLAEPILELGIPTLIVVTMVDELHRRRGSLDAEGLSERLGVDVVMVNGRTGEGMDAVRSFIDGVVLAANSAPRSVRGAATPEAGPGEGRSSRIGLPLVQALEIRREFVRRALQAADYRPAGASKWTEGLDNVLLHRFVGPALFAVLAVLVFQAIFTWAVPAMDATEAVIAGSGEWLAARLPDTWFQSLLVDGVWAGVGSVMVFLPQILILFFFIGILEDSGYMARAAVIADRMMMRVGLQGRAFLPLLSGYACAVPAVLASRVVEDERDRLATMFITPFMTCSARLPVYALLIAAFIPEGALVGPFLGTRAAALLGLYVLGLLAAIATSFGLRRTILAGKSSDFLMELPPYRLPSLRSTVQRLVDRTRIFLRRAGKIIFTVTVVLWGLTQFPRVDGEPPVVAESALGAAGQVIEPAIEPLGFDWRVGVGLVASLAAREVIVGTLGTIYGIEDADETSLQLRDALQRDLDLGSAVALLVFFAFALQCLSTVAVMRRETGGWRWPAAQFTYMLALAYAAAFAANRLL